MSFNYLASNFTGYFVSCERGRESVSGKEVIALLDTYARELHPEQFENDANEEATDLNLEQELQLLKKPQKKQKGAFTIADENSKKSCSVFIRVNAAKFKVCPAKFLSDIFADLEAKKRVMTKYTSRIRPIQTSCAAHMAPFADFGKKFLALHVKPEETLTYKVDFTRHYNDDFPREESTMSLSHSLLALSPNSRVDYKTPQVNILLEVFKGAVFLSFLRTTDFPRGYNIRAYCSVDGLAASQIVHNNSNNDSNSKTTKDKKQGKGKQVRNNNSRKQNAESDEGKLKRDRVDEEESGNLKKSKLTNEENPGKSNLESNYDAKEENLIQESEDLSSNKRRIIEAMDEIQSESSDEEPTMRIF